MRSVHGGRTSHGRTPHLPRPADGINLRFLGPGGPGTQSAVFRNVQASPVLRAGAQRARRPEPDSAGRTPRCRSRSDNRNTSRVRYTVRTWRTRADGIGTGPSGRPFRSRHRSGTLRRRPCPRSRPCARAAARQVLFKSSCPAFSPTAVVNSPAEPPSGRQGCTERPWRPDRRGPSTPVRQPLREGRRQHLIHQSTEPESAGKSGGHGLETSYRACLSLISLYSASRQLGLPAMTKLSPSRSSIQVYLASSDVSLCRS